MSTTIYDIKLRYSADDTATGKVNRLADASDRAAKSGLNLKAILATIGGGAAFAAGKKLLVDYNVEMQRMKIGMGTVISMQMKKPFAEARKEADILVDRLQQVAKKSPGTTKDFVDMANQIAPAVAMFGGGIDKIEKLASGGVIAALATGTRSETAGMDIKQMLAGTVASRDMMANQLIASHGMDAKTFNAKSAKERALLVEQMLTDPALKKAADAFGDSFEGVVSTFKDQMQIAFGNVGLPLMKDITREVQKWNTWIEKNPVKIAMFTKTLASGLSKAFEFLRSTAEFFVQHSDTLITIAKAYGIFKVGSIVGASINSVTNGLNNFAKGLSDARSGFLTLIGQGGGTGGGVGLVGGFTRLLGALSPVTVALGALAGAAWGLWELTKDHTKEEWKKNGQFVLTAYGEDAAKDVERKAAISKRLDELGRLGAAPGYNGYDENGNLVATQQERLRTELENINKRNSSPEAMKQAGAFLRAIYENGGSEFISEDFHVDAEKLRRFGKSGSIPASALRYMRALAGRDPNARNYSELNRELDLSSYRRYAFPDQYAAEADPNATEWKDVNPTTPDVNITIQKIEVASDDPDRFVFGAVKAFEKAAKNPTQAQSTIAGGF